MSSIKIPLEKIIIGTASWGSKISYNEANNIAKQLITNGFDLFDTAPNYGSGYSQNIINNILTKKKVSVNTKFGQKINFSIREILKRIYRFNNFKSFINSNLNLFNYSLNRNDEFWSVLNLDKNFKKIKNDLNNCLIKTFFLHSPSNKFLTSEYLSDFSKFCILNNITCGVSNVSDDIFPYLMSNHKNFVFQMSLTQYFKYEKIITNNNMIHINSIYSSKYLQNRVSIKNYDEDIFKYFLNKSHVKLILGINSKESVKKLLYKINQGLLNEDTKN